MRLTRSSWRASAQTVASPRRSQSGMSRLCQKGLPSTSAAADAIGGRLRGAFSAAMSLATGSSSTSRASSSSLSISAGTSVTLAFLTRSMSRATARCRALKRGCAARARRVSADLSAASRGSALPVSSACCCASRSSDSTSTTRFSSRERDRLCISSSSWLRCRLISPSRVSCNASRAASPRASSCASRAKVRASIAWAPESAWRRASSS